MTLRVVSYGGGVQSTALLVLAAQRRIDFQTFLFANVGDDSEDPATLEYLASYAAPYAAHVLALPGMETVQALGFTRSGAPRHPLYLPGDAVPVPYRGVAA